MKRTLTLLVLAALALGTLYAAAKQGTLEGELVDAKCYIVMGTKGEKHQACATKCAKSGLPLAVAANSGTYIVLHPAPEIGQYAASQVRITGEIHEDSKTISPSKMEVKKGAAWQEVNLKPAM
ncbi:MAG: hypothetical protein HY652_09795 [Acidobacteria bacterium]|nr:hypothetical protein [Acidobacteriota bacterium]